MNGPRLAGDFSDDVTERVRQALLSIVEALGDLADTLCVVGGLVPSLLELDAGADIAEPHVGTTELDLVLSTSMLDGERYAEVAARLRQLGMRPTRTAAETDRHQTWELPDIGITVDFLIDPEDTAVRGGSTKHLERDFAAFNIPGVQLAFIDAEQVELSGLNLQQHRSTRTVQVCSVPVFIMLKALAIAGRNEPKDCYDLVYVLQRHSAAIEQVATRLHDLRPHDATGRITAAIDVLARDFATIDHVGPQRYAQFQNRGTPDDDRQDAFGVVQLLLSRLALRPGDMP